MGRMLGIISLVLSLTMDGMLGQYTLQMFCTLSHLLYYAVPIYDRVT
jgi:hypothetical protein